MRNSTLLKVLNNSEYQKVPSEMKRWNKVTVNGEKVVSDGLMRRREAESLLFKDEPWHEV
jgi:lysozyme